VRVCLLLNLDTMSQRARMFIAQFRHYTSQRARMFVAQFRYYVTTCAYVCGSTQILRHNVRVCLWLNLDTTSQRAGMFMAQFRHYVTMCVYVYGSI
jgi:hypothetical protein